MLRPCRKSVICAGNNVGMPQATKRTKSGNKYRSLWISDVHLGTPGCKAGHLADFLKAHDCDTLYLVGDIIDGWRLKSGWYWPQEHSNVVRKVLTKAKRGTQIYYVTGNHDEFLRKFVGFGLSVGNIRVVNEHVHITADGRRLLVLHGDDFDVITRYHRWLALAGAGRRRRLRGGDACQLLVKPSARTRRPAVLVAVGVRQAARQDRRQRHLQLRGRRGARVQTPRPRWRRLWPHPPRRNTPAVRHRLPQLR